MSEIAEVKNEVMVYDDAGMGFEDVVADDLLMPWLKIVQKSSKVIDENDEARAGMILNTVTGELYKDGIFVVPAAKQTVLVEWEASEGGGRRFIAKYDKNDPVAQSVGRNERGIPVLANGNLICETWYFPSLIVGDDGASPVMISMDASNLKHARKWLNTMMSFKHPTGAPQAIFSRTYHLTTTQETKDANTWYVWQHAVAYENEVSSDLYADGKQLCHQFRAGALKTEEPTVGDTADS